MSHPVLFRGACLAAFAWFLAWPSGAAAQDAAGDAASFFQQKCTSCHTIGGGRLTGPDLKDVTQRQPREWLVAFIQNPQAAMDRGDPYAQKLLAEARGVVMNRIDGMNPATAAALMDLIEAESALETSRFAGMALADRPLTPEDSALGRALFLGEQRLSAGGPACLSCHHTQGTGGLGGGRLGPDLTDVFARLEGRRGLAAWLLAPPSQTMQPVYSKAPLSTDEVLALTAWLGDQAAAGPAPAQRAAATPFLVLGLVGAALVLLLMDWAWRWRFHAVRRPLVEGIAEGGRS